MGDGGHAFLRPLHVQQQSVPSSGFATDAGIAVAHI